MSKPTLEDCPYLPIQVTRHRGVEFWLLSNPVYVPAHLWDRLLPNLQLPPALNAQLFNEQAWDMLCWLSGSMLRFDIQKSYPTPGAKVPTLGTVYSGHVAIDRQMFTVIFHFYTRDTRETPVGYIQVLTSTADVSHLTATIDNEI